MPQFNYDPNGLSQDTTRGPSKSIWADCPVLDLRESFGGGGQTPGVILEDDFLTLGSPTVNQVSSAFGTGSCGPWASYFGAANQTVKDGAEEGGVMKLDGATANKSTILTSNAGAFRMVGASTAYPLYGKLWFEFRVALGSVSASQQGVFVGLCDNTSSQINSLDTTVIATAGNTLTTTKNLIGFFNRTTTCPADFSVVYQPAGGTAVYPTGLTTPVNGVTGSSMAAYAASSSVGQGTGFVKLGMVFDPTPNAGPAVPAPSTCPSGQTAGVLYRPTIRFFVNGQQTAAFLAPTNLQASTFPNSCVFAPVINYMNIAGGPAPIYVDWIRVAQVGAY